MNTYDEIKNAIDNIAHYADKIDSLTREQFNYDLEHSESIIHSTNRLDILGALGGATRGVKLLCEQMYSNLKHSREVNLPINEEQEMLL